MLASHPLARAPPPRRGRQGVCVFAEAGGPPPSRRVLLSTAFPLVLGALVDLRGARPRDLGLQRFGGSAQLGLCPRSPDCISTAEEVNDAVRFVPPWTYNSEEWLARGGREKRSRAQAMQQLVEAVAASRPDGYVPKIVKQTEEYLQVEYTRDTPTYSVTDDVEFYLPPGELSRVEYRSASRTQLPLQSEVNRRRIRALREALQGKGGWRSVGY